MKRNLIWKVTKSTAVSAATLLAVALLLSAWWGWHYEPEPVSHAQFTQTRLDHFNFLFIVMSLNLFIPLAICSTASMLLALWRGTHNMIAGALSGAVIFGLTALEYSVGIHHRSLILGRVLLFGVIPLIATSLQFIRIPKNRKTSNKPNGE